MDAHAEISALIARYAHAVDDGRVDDVVRCFARDGVLAVDDHPPIVGPSALAKPFERLALRLRTDGIYLRHSVSSIEVFELDADAGRARARSYFIVMSHGGADHWGTYDDDVVVEDGAWRFARRVVRIDGRAGPSVLG